MIALNDRTRLTVSLTFFRDGTIMDEERISGVVDSITYQNSENGYTVLDIETSDGDIFTAVGLLSSLIPGEHVTLEGSWMVHSSYGRQFKVETVEREKIKTADDQYNYLASGAIKGIREGMARKLIEAFGEETFDIIEHDPVRLASIKGISKHKAIEISEYFCMKFAEREIIISLEQYGITPSESMKLYGVFGSKAVEVIERNPYIVCDENIGAGFERAEAIACRLREAPDENYRLAAGVKYVLYHNLSNGHTCIPREKLLKPCGSLLEKNAEEIDKTISFLAEKKEIICDDVNGKEFVFLPDLYVAEMNCARELNCRKYGCATGSIVSDESIEKAELISGICYNSIQRIAIRTAVEQGLLVLTGGPGTGKTTTIRAILSLFDDNGVETVLAAPTGRAAKRMSELTGREAKTIHRLLEVEWDKYDHPVFVRNRRNPIVADAIIVDELSMVDVRLFASLLDALPMGCRIIMVGDSDQLPPVGAGNVLHDIILSKILPVVELKEVFRQAMESEIVVNAHKIVRGEIPDLFVRDNDFFFLERTSAAAAADTIKDLCNTRLPNAYNFSAFDDIQVIAPSKIGETGTSNLNNLLQASLNPPSSKKKEFKSSGRIFREGDKVMQIKNNYDIEWKSISDGMTGLGIFNGEIGVIKSIDIGGAAVNIRFDDKDVVYPMENATQLELAYAITVHKSQGSEFRAVIVPMIGIPEKLAYRNLLYTAVTRAREILIIVGSRSQLVAMINNNVKSKRYSALQSFLVTENTIDH